MYNCPVYNGCSTDVSCHHHHHHHCHLEGLICLGGNKREEYHHTERNREEGTFQRLKDESGSTSRGLLKSSTADIQGYITLSCRGPTLHTVKCLTLSMAYTHQIQQQPPQL